MTLPAIKIEQLNYFYRTDWLFTRVQRLKNINLEVKAGECFGFLGHNGAGKTTLIKCLLDLLKPTNGSIKIFGECSTSARARASIGFLPEQPYFYDLLTVYELLSFYGRLSGLSRQTLAVQINEVLNLLKIHDRKCAKLSSLSKGLVQRVAMAQAIIAKPRLLILDEPFSGLDPIGRRDFLDLLLNLKASGTTIFISSHILHDIEQLCDRASILVKGEIKGIIDLHEITNMNNKRYRLLVSGLKTSTAHEDLNPSKILTRGTATEFLFENYHEAVKAFSILSSHSRIVKFEHDHSGLEEMFIKVVEGSNA